MIRHIHLQNFKCFHTQKLQLAPLTLLSGLNGMGKSSVIQSLLLLRQSYQQGLLPDVGLALNGDLTRLGNAKDVLYSEAETDKIQLTIEVDSPQGVTMPGSWSFIAKQQTDVLFLAVDELEEDPDIYQSSLFSDRFQYLQAERLGPRIAYGTSDYQVRQHRQLGTQGEYTAYFLSLFGNKDIPNHDLQHVSAMSLSLVNQVEAWMAQISPGTRLKLTSVPDLDQVGLRYSFVSGTYESAAYRATNVGFGLTYILPVLVAILASEPDTLLLIENPEAHLHPMGQAMIGELLAKSAQAGVQVILETHSDHVLNGIRLAVHRGTLAPENAQLYFFERQENQNGFIEHRAIPLKLDRDGRIDFWPEGFFDEWDKSLESLLEPRR